MSIERQAPEGKAGARGPQQPERWEIDADRSSLEFSLRHLVISEIKGRFRKWGGTLILDREHPEQSHLTAWVELESIETGEAERDDHVKSPEFLDVKRFPRARFVSTAVTPSDAGILVRGRLDMHGVARDIEIQVTPWVRSHAEEPRRGLYQAKASVDRQSFGLHWNQDLDIGGIVVGDKIDLRARVEMTPASDDDGSPIH
jgi:polyisoprenoid-binding protein YceI